MAVKTRVDGRIARISLDAPKLNILTSAMQDELRLALEGLRRTRDHNVVVLDSAVPGVFSAGADVAEHMGREAVKRMLQSAHGLIAEVLACPVPVVCLVDGPCLGGAFELALGCDQIVASTRSSFGTPEIALGCYPPAAVVLMPWKLPALLAHELVQSGRIVDASELEHRGGLRIGDQQAVLPYADLPRGPLEHATALLRGGRAGWFKAAIAPVEAAYLDKLLQMPDALEGPAAFIEKRKPRWDHSSSEIS